MTQAVMLQGTASDVGKSVLAAGLCRIFYQDGLRTAPFKSQNMALNSGITPDGKEMGRAQIFQAEAAGITPDVRMNPVLLKPTAIARRRSCLMGKVATNYGCG
ncbi:cobyric acid synthase [Salmonella enterica subsp. enterica]|uniref:Cobyric acid synthase n=1 Tax=Salmonella enterica I TaxID=59201 RepID=A0A379WRE5_SALET|nr:cobyric acid synthase [Salmonella enterica subsp. enterica]